MNIKRTGDISYHPATLPENAEKISTKTFVLAEGEATGHLHEVTVKEGTVDIYRDANKSLFLVINGKAVLTHPEHKTLEIDTGTYEIRNEKEFDWFSMATRKVVD